KMYFIPVKRNIFLLVILLLLMQSIKRRSFKLLNEEYVLLVFFLISLIIMIPFAYYYEGWIGGRVTLVPDVVLFIVLFRLILKTFNVEIILNKFNFYVLFSILVAL